MAFSLLNEEERYLSAHIADLQRLSIKSGVPRFSQFLNEREAVVADNAVKGSPCFFGGYDGAARVVCGFIEDTYASELPPSDIFPIIPLTFTYRERDKLTHRDFLGALLSLEIKRELVGDILTADGYAVVFVHETAAELVSALDKIGKVGVRCERGITKPLPEQQTKRIDATVSSLRLDCIVSAAVNISRERSASLVKSGMVNADFSPCLNVSAEMKENTVISVRGHGRFRLSEISGETRKGRIRIVIEKYI
ncbi:MAG: RNA-binding protein [Oscillospiraceae bacterium]|nr:RNA-binding protein [Oscillospiraceae bacterium]